MSLRHFSAICHEKVKNGQSAEISGRRQKTPENIKRHVLLAKKNDVHVSKPLYKFSHLDSRFGSFSAAPEPPNITMLKRRIATWNTPTSPPPNIGMLGGLGGLPPLIHAFYIVLFGKRQKGDSPSRDAIWATRFTDCDVIKIAKKTGEFAFFVVLTLKIASQHAL